MTGDWPDGLPDAEAIARRVERLAELGYRPVEPENPHWKPQGTTIEDPDGWRLVLMQGRGLSPREPE